MKKLISCVLMIVLALGSIGLAACGSEGEEGETTPPASNGEATSPAEEEAPPPAGSLSWSDIPAYSGASQVQKGGWAVPPAQGEWSKVEWRYYESGDSADRVASFYRGRMPDQGWDEMMWMEAEGVAWAYYTRNGERDGAMFWVTSDENKTIFALMRATQ